MFLPILNGSYGRVEHGLLPVNISNGDGRVELMVWSYIALGHNSMVFHLSLIFPSVSW